MRTVLLLMRKDLIVIRRWVPVSFLMIFAYGLVAYRFGAYQMMTVLWSVGLHLSLMSCEHRNESERVLCSLPIRRSSIVFGRYTVAVGFCLLAASVSLLFAPIHELIFPRAFTDIGRVVSLRAILLVVLTGMLVNAVCLLPMFALGVGRGFWVASMVPIVGLIVLAVVARGLRSTGMAGAVIPFAAVASRIAEILGRTKATGSAILATLAILAVYLISMAGAVTLFRRRSI